MPPSRFAVHSAGLHGVLSWATVLTVMRRLALVAVNLAVLVVLAETAALVAYYSQTGHLFYFHERSESTFQVAENRRLNGDALHPYFGPTHKPGVAFDIPESLRGPNTRAGGRTNNFGFASEHDYPYARTSPNQFLVGIFGGSVGVWFCHLGVDPLVEDLKRDRAFAEREIVPLCFSHEGYKQPQQLLLLSYFLSLGQELDLAINIDGFNEVAIGRLNDERRVDVSMPSVLHLDPLMNVANQATLTPEKLQLLAGIDRLKWRRDALTARLERNRFASVHVVLDVIRARAARDHQASVAAFAALPSASAEDSVIRPTPALRDRGGDLVFADIAREWANASVLMHQLLAARGTPYFHFLQPNQYFTQRPFAGDEARVARNEGSPFKPGAERGYPLLLGDGAAILEQGGVNFFDATRVFDAERAAVYMDDCCHYTRRGNELLAAFVARAILATPATIADGLTAK
jgi:hypothetical protein